jgi:hypothetical protein
MKIQELDINSKYTVLKRKEINTKFGKTYILLVLDESKNEFELFATKYLSEYIDKEKPEGPFEFTVTGHNNMKHAKIENYNRGFIPF